MNPDWAANWGTPGAGALAALLLALLLGGWLAPQWRVQADAARRAARVALVAAGPLPAAPKPQPQLPAVGEASERVADLLRLAARHGVDVARTQQQRSEQNGPLPRLQVGLNARGRYAELRGFIAAALQADPGLALDSLQWRRAGAGVDLLEAELQWSLWQAPTTVTVLR